MADRSSYIGTEIGSYRIIAEINSGAYGAVYQAKHVIFDDDPIVAIKLLHAHLTSVEEREQFIQEARLLRKLKHPHILPILDAGIQDGIPYLVTDNASGGSLQDRLKQQVGKLMPVDEALTIITQIGQALYYAHQQNVVHRDLKPGNILFNAKGEALLADFGIAVILATARTRNLGQGGTPAYMAPEQFEGKVSIKSDQYSLGCIAYELLTGRRPYYVLNPTVEAMWFQHAKVIPVAPTRLNTTLPAHIEQSILKAMAKERTERHADVSVFIGSLQKPAILQKTAQQYLVEGNDLYKAKRYEEALVAYEQAIRSNPNYASAYVRKGKALHNLNRCEKALLAYEQAICLDPNDAVSHYGKGKALLDLKRYEEALVAFEQAIDLDPDDAVAYNGKGYVLLNLYLYEEALVTYEQAICLDPNDAVSYNEKGRALYCLKRYEEALEAFEQAICLNPNNAVAYNNKGDALHNLYLYEEALGAYEQAIHLDPNDAVAYNGKGSVLSYLKQNEEALEAYEQAIRLAPKGAVIYSNKGYALSHLNRNREALEAYERAIRLDPRLAAAYYGKGQVLKKLGRSVEARKYYKIARELGYNG